MPPKPPSREEEFELVLGNKQLLSLFFIVVGFFAAFFSVGYMVGFGHGEKSAGASSITRVEEPAPKPAERTALPPTLMQDPPAPPPAVPAETAKPSPSQAAAATSTPAPSPPKTTPAPESKPKPAQTAPEKRPEPTTAATKSASKPPPTGTAPDGSRYFLQVAAVRVEADAVELAGKLKAKGYPATVSSEKNDGWQRVLVGPFQSEEAAGSFKDKLGKDGFDTMLRKL
jgi:cell division protein FtsN